MAGTESSIKLTKRTVDAAQPKVRLYRLWDCELKGFGLKVTPAGAKTYIATYRVGTGRGAPQREFTLGRHGKLTPDQARDEALRVLSAARLGGDPQAERSSKRSELTVAQLCDLYLAQGTGKKKASTLSTDRGRISSHIKPLLGGKRISTVTAGDVEKFMRDVAVGKTATLPRKVGFRAVSQVRGGKGTASRTVGLLGGIFSFAIRSRLLSENPVRGVQRYEDGRSERFLTAAELARLGAAIAVAERNGSNRYGLAVIRLLITTGARKNEIEGLRWDEVDFERSILRLRDSKTGAKTIPVGAPALAILSGVAAERRVNHPEFKDESPFVFPASRNADGHWTGTPKVWETVRREAGLPNVRMHDLRHTFASLAIGAAGGGNSLAIIGKLLGHADVKTTARYAHLADDPVRQAADRISRAAAASLAGEPGEIMEIS